MARKAKQQVAFRLPTDMLARIDRVMRQLQAENPGVDVTRTYAARVIIDAGLAQFEQRRSKSRSKRSR